ARNGTATRRRCDPLRIDRRRGCEGRASRSSRSAAPVGRGRPARRGRAAALPPQLALVDLLALPEAGGEVLPASVGEDADHDAVVELARQTASDVEHGAARDSGEDPLAVEERMHTCDRLIVRNEDLPVELPDVEDRRDI